jgi:16S rRNA (guanine527-N7)-methyltransferase
MKTKLSNQEIIDSLAIYGIAANMELCDQIRAYIATLLRWNQKISLTTVSDLSEIVRFHFGESFFAASAVPIRHGRLADVGSGAGFPGLAIRILIHQIDLVLIESNVKKAAFLSEVSRELCLDRVEVFHGRMEEFQETSPRLDFITARALGQHEKLLEWSGSHLNLSGKLILWLGEEDSAAISRDPAWSWDKPIKLPESQRRVLLVGSARQSS